MATLISDPTIRVNPAEDTARLDSLRAVVAEAYRGTAAAVHDDFELLCLIWNRLVFVGDDLGHLIVGHDGTLFDLTLRQRLHDAFLTAWTDAGGAGSVTTAPYMKIGKPIEGGVEPIVTIL